MRDPAMEPTWYVVPTWLEAACRKTKVSGQVG